MTYVILFGLVVGCSIWTYYLGVRIEALRKDVAKQKDFMDRQKDVLTAFLKIANEKDKLDDFIKNLDDVTDAEQFNRLLQARVSSIASSTASR